MKKTTTTTTTVVTVVEESSDTGGVLAVFALDNSGSMNFKTKDAIDGFNGYLEGIRETVPFLTLGLFNDKLNKMYNVVPTKNVQPLTTTTYRAGGSTALYDTIGTLVADTERYIESNPGVISEVIVTIFTDGQENGSTTYSLASIKNLITKKEAEGNWTFVFMGSELNTYSQGASMGFSAVNTVMYDQNNTKLRMRTAGTATAAYSVRADKMDKDFFASENLDQKFKSASAANPSLDASKPAATVTINPKVEQSNT